MPNYRRAFVPGGCWFFTHNRGLDVAAGGCGFLHALAADQDAVREIVAEE
jgi:hypothetical protein